MGELFLLRLAVGIIFLCHAIPKLKEPKGMASGMGWSLNQALALGIVEFVAALGLIGGIAVGFSSLALIVVMAGAIYHKISIWKIPFISSSNTGWEFDFLLLAANLTIYLNYY